MSTFFFFFIFVSTTIVCHSQQEDEFEQLDQELDPDWGTRSRRAEFPVLTPKQIQHCVREIQSSMNCKCEVKDVSVDVPAQIERDQYTFPKCISAKRCSGPCWGDKMRCMPTQTDIMRVPVIRPSCKKDFVNVEIHKECKCTCMLTADDCQDGQVFDPNACKCECKRRKCPVDYHYNMQTCRCECFDDKECSTGLVFNPVTCECEDENSV